MTNLESHFVDMDGEMVGAWLSRLDNVQSAFRCNGIWLAIENEQIFKEAARQRAAKLVLHHPHTTVKCRTWMQAWHGLRRDLPSVVSYLGTGCYSFKDTKHGLSRDLRDDVLDGTKSPDTVDIVVSMAQP
jgi:hypothetical protein